MSDLQRTATTQLLSLDEGALASEVTAPDETVALLLSFLQEHAHA